MTDQQKFTKRLMQLYFSKNPGKILNFILVNPGKNQTEIVESLDLKQSCVSNIIKELVKHGLVKTKIIGHFTHYKINEPNLKTLMETFTYLHVNLGK